MLFNAEASSTIEPPTIPLPLSDPWGAADFSVFESKPNPSALLPTFETESDRSPPIAVEPAEYFGHRPITPPVTRRLPVASNPGVASKGFRVEQDFTPTTPLELNPPLPLPQSEEEGDKVGSQPPAQDDAIRQIVDNLPDLSYMLR